MRAIWGRLSLAIAGLLLGVVLAAPAPAQSPLSQFIPGGQGNQQAQNGTAAEAPATDPAAELIEILRDPVALEALIQRLEEAAAEPAADAPPAEPAPEETLLQPGLLSSLWNATGETLRKDVEMFLSRLQRVPTTFSLAFRGLDPAILARALRDTLVVALVAYATFLVLRLVIFRVAQRMLSHMETLGWFRTFWGRLLVSAAELAALALAWLAGMLALILRYQGAMPDAQAAAFVFLSAFLITETVLIVLRFVLSPGFPKLRLITAPDHGVRVLQRIGTITAVLLGYGQFFLVPVISSETSVFVGRATSTLFGTLVVLYLIAAVLFHRKKVSRWASEREGKTAIDRITLSVAQYWHIPVLIYLLVLLAVVVTRPGNVLIPLLWSTALGILAIAVGLMASAAVSRAASRRVRVPALLAERLPLLEMRVNRMVPAVALFLRVVIFSAVVLVVLDLMSLIDLAGLMASDNGNRTFRGLFNIAILAFFFWLAWLAVSSWIDYRLNPFVGTPPTPRTITLMALLRNVTTITLVIFFVMFALLELGMNVGPVIASAGVLGLAISFGAQSLVQDFITGTFIQLENAMNVGDVVTVNNVTGTVEKLTVRSVTLRDLNGVVHMIPFSSATMISNYMREFSYHVADIGVAYREDIEEVREALRDAFDELRADPEQSEKILDDLEWFGLNAFGPSELIVRVRIKTQPGAQWGIGRAYNAIVKRIFDERGIEIPYPHQTVYFGQDRKGQAPPVHVALDAGNAGAEGEENTTDAPEKG